MRYLRVTAMPFGPFRHKPLELAPGMNVIHGPNEAGKSSLHSALYVGLCGIRRAQGPPTKEDREFAERHRPWNGEGGDWEVGALIQLECGRRIELHHDLATRTGTAIHADCHRPYLVQSTDHEGHRCRHPGKRLLESASLRRGRGWFALARTQPPILQGDSLRATGGHSGCQGECHLPPRCTRGGGLHGTRGCLGGFGAHRPQGVSRATRRYAKGAQEASMSGYRESPEDTCEIGHGTREAKGIPRVPSKSRRPSTHG